MTASFTLDAHNGGRLSSIRIGDYELLYGDPSLKPTSWGAYPMVPFAGRIADGRFSFDGSDYELPINHGDHAIHGTAFTSPWQEVGPGHLVQELDDRWPFGGNVSHRAELAGDQSEGQLILELGVLASARAMPAMVGWHPWFNRTLTDGGPQGILSIPDLEHAEMYVLDSRSIPLGTVQSPPSPGPWDHPFRSVGQPIGIEWDGELAVELTSTCDHWVIYNRPEYAFCVEPQSGPPNIFNPSVFDLEPHVLRRGEELVHRFTIRWRSL